jgi:GGDEF domain-containing protein
MDRQPLAVMFIDMDNFAKLIKFDGHELLITGSIGISLFPDDGDEPNHLINKADVAMYRAKGKGCNGIVSHGTLTPHPTF